MSENAGMQPQDAPFEQVARVYGRLWRDLPRHLGYLLMTGAPAALVVVVGLLGWAITGFWFAAPLVVPVVLFIGWCAPRIARSDRALTAWASRRPMPAPDDTDGARRGLLPQWQDPAARPEIGWAFLSLVLSPILSAIALWWTMASLAVVTAWPETISLRHRDGDTPYPGLGSLVYRTDTFANRSSLAVRITIFSLFFVLTLPVVAGLLSTIRAALARQFLCPSDTAVQLRTSRDAGRVAETTRLRQLERDIHDGPQQRLVRLTMDLARTKQVVGRDPEHAQEMLDAAMLSAQETLGELRNLSRGIAPPVLVDRGLEAALTELAALSGVPVTLHAELPPELPDHVATAAYFAASEALTNVNKHSLASHVQMICGVQDHWLFLTVTDDGVGGARFDKGHGLAGLAQRLRAVDGQLDLDSPEGGGTRLEAVILCRS